MGATSTMHQLQTGAQVAWTTKQGGKTTGLSSVHRVYDATRTYCSQPIPGDDRRDGIAPLLPVLNVCKRCERMYGQALVAEREGRS